MMTPDQRVAAIDAAVKLTDEQKPKVLAIVTDSQKEMQDARGAAAGDRQAMMTKMQEINKKANDAIKALLTPDQQKAFDAMPQMGGRRGGGGGKKGGGGGGGGN
jgi:periplasmic protein CpxP/Spy